jgi:hypothetical protein
MFHANLLMPYKETELHGPNFTRPPPDLIDGEPEYEVEKILDTQPRGRGHKMHFLVKWKGYPMCYDCRGLCLFVLVYVFDLHRDSW